ncbi:sigma factor-like helix-turn-helix DNA-binding protein [Mycoplasma procyoni]|uniref:sigma factor-like helix-turn-helix DNA-binding protein n=1 Tax=Mycoplasma procyoni TaxID=568784 RepID=UPI00197BBEDB|nr:sigma factor-like helix-turn-helix DNA-binding protein [Mycoplasma procyoni]MBN3534941.1 hypothetical protein [Mycoplasma procyoni]
MEDLEKKEEMISLFEKYSGLLTQTQKQAFALFYFEDLSISEIAQELASSRGAAFDALKKAREKLLKIEKSIEN